MAKRKITGPSKGSKNDTKVTAIVVGLFAAAIILFLIVSKAKEPANTENIKENVRENVKENVKENKETVSQPAFNESSELPTPAESSGPAEPETVSRPEAPVPLHNILGSGGKIAIILDDWGQTTTNCKYLKEIPEPLAISILPGLRHTKDVANCAKLYHKLTMLHLPLEALHNGDFYPPNYIIKTTMKPELVAQIVEQDLDQLPSIEGVNNHMGSKATADRALMKIIFKKIKVRNLFFVDSMTSPHSVSAALADEMGLHYGKRDVFLDNINTREAITKQIVELARKARRRGYAVAIGHDRHVTMEVLKDEIPWLEKQGLQIVSIKELLHYR